MSMLIPLQAKSAYISGTPFFIELEFDLSRLPMAPDGLLEILTTLLEVGNVHYRHLGPVCKDARLSVSMSHMLGPSSSVLLR